MAAIHIGKISQVESGKGKAHLIYHIPIDVPVAGVVPTPESVVADQLEQTERDALATGAVIEITKDIIVLENQTQAEITTAIKANWQNVKTEYNKQYNFEHKFYGVTLDAGA